jgi:hypothetical protein
MSQEHTSNYNACLPRLLEFRRHPEIVAALMAMRYDLLLNTWYWFLIRAYTLYQRGQHGDQCQGAEGLYLYHLRKNRQGSELFHPEDGHVVCRTFHATYRA